MPQHEKLDYVEFPARDLKATQAFFSSVFGWQFENFGPDYCAFCGQGLDGGFYRSELYSITQNGSALLVFYSDDLEATLVAGRTGRWEHCETHLRLSRRASFPFQRTER